MEIQTITDAETFVNNSGVADWDWSDSNGSFDGFVKFIYKNYNEVDLDDYDAELRAYAVSVGDNPSDYGL